jgi:hypothetical protein
MNFGARAADKFRQRRAAVTIPSAGFDDSIFTVNAVETKVQSARDSCRSCRSCTTASRNLVTVGRALHGGGTTGLALRLKVTIDVSPINTRSTAVRSNPDFSSRASFMTTSRRVHSAFDTTSKMRPGERDHRERARAKRIAPVYVAY